MAAGGLSYSGLTNHAKVTLPCVESWGTNMNILRDPPKSIHTRKIDKVGEISNMTAMIDDSGDRVSESIMVYARGVNPSVSVSYSNLGNNGGQSGGSLTGLNNTQSAKLPYRINRDGAFRPPVLKQEQLLPLSRQPRIWTSQFSQPGFTDFSKRVKNCGTADETKEVHTDILKGNIRPTAVYKIETPIQETYDIKNNIQNIINTTANSGIRTLDITQQNVQVPTHQIFETPLHADANSNRALPQTQILDNNMDTERYLQNPNYKVVNSNRALPQTQILDNNMDTERYLQNPNYKVVNSNRALPQTQILDNNMDTVRYLQNPNYKVVNSNRALPQTQILDNNMDTERYLQNPNNKVVNSNRALPQTQILDNNMDTERYLQNPNYKVVNSNRALPQTQILDNNMDTVRYLQNPNYKVVNSNRALPQTQILDNNMDTERYLQNPNNKVVNSNRALPQTQILDNNMDTERYLQNPNYKVVNSNRALPQTQILDNNMDTERYLQNPNYKVVNSNRALPQTQILDNNMDTERYLQNPNYKVVNSNRALPQTQILDNEVLDLPEMPIQNVHIIDHTAPYSRGGDGTKYIHKDIERTRQLPSYSSYTNIVDNTRYKHNLHENTIELERNIPSGEMYTNTNQLGEYNNSSRTVNLIPKIHAGEFSIPASRPLENHIQKIPVLQETDKQRMSRLIMESQTRYAVSPPKH